MVYSIGSLLELAYLSDDVWYLTEKQQSKAQACPWVAACSPGSPSLSGRPLPPAVTGALPDHSLCSGLSCFQWAVQNANSKKILNSQSGEQLALGGLRLRGWKLWVLLSTGSLLLTRCSERGCWARSLQCLSLVSLQRSSQELSSPLPLLRLRAARAQLKISVGQHQVLDPVPPCHPLQS